MEMLGTYQLTGHLTSQNSGYSVWGFGTKDGKDYFLKQFLSPKYPENDTASSPERIARVQKKCHRFEEKKAAIYQQINENSDGNAVRIEEFFRIGTKYYISMKKIHALPYTVEDVAALSEGQKRFLCGTIAHGIACLHKGHVVHADLKHDNILFTKLPSGFLSVKIIDFDSGFLETDPPGDGEEIVGDQVYFSPEACMIFLGMTPELTCKMDVFSLGILFHQYFAGELPGYNGEMGTCLGEAVARGDQAVVSENLSPDIRALLVEMLSANPGERPTAMQVHDRILKIAPAKETPVPATAPAQSGTQNVFFRPGDL